MSNPATDLTQAGDRIGFLSLSHEWKYQTIWVECTAAAPALVRSCGTELVQKAVRTGRNAPALFVRKGHAGTPVVELDVRRLRQAWRDNDGNGLAFPRNAGRQTRNVTAR